MNWIFIYFFVNIKYILFAEFDVFKIINKKISSVDFLWLETSKLMNSPPSTIGVPKIISNPVTFSPNDQGQKLV